MIWLILGALIAFWAAIVVAFVLFVMISNRKEERWLSRYREPRVFREAREVAGKR